MSGLLVCRPASGTPILAARGENRAAFGGRCIPPGGVAPPLHIPDMRGRRALPGGRLARLGATPGFHHGLLAEGRREGNGAAADEDLVVVAVVRRAGGGGHL